MGLGVLGHSQVWWYQDSLDFPPIWEHQQVMSPRYQEEEAGKMEEVDNFQVLEQRCLAMMLQG